MGVASGEVHERDGDYFGPTLNRVARVMGAGHGGQIVVSDSAAALVSGIDLLDLGEHRLRDLAASVRLFQVRAEGLESVFPALRTLDATPGNLPVQLTSFVGRELEVKEVGELVRAHRLVTLTGVGGVGKTRLSVQVAAELTHEFPDGIWVVELATIGDPAAVPDAVATALGVTPAPDASVDREHRGGPVGAAPAPGARQLRARPVGRRRPRRHDPERHRPPCGSWPPAVRGCPSQRSTCGRFRPSTPRPAPAHLPSSSSSSEPRR